jgi:glycosyltransferase involved in cell wall biosynthesis
MIVVGGGKFTEEETNIIKRLNLENKIHNIGFVSDEELIMLYNCTDAFVFPTLYEGFGIPILEAMACGTPTTLSNSSSLPEIAENSALYFNPKNINDMAKKIQQTISEGRNSNRVKLGLDRVKLFSWYKTTQKTLNVYKKIYEKTIK